MLHTSDAGPPVECPRNEAGSKSCTMVFLGWHFEIVEIGLTLQERLVYFMKYGPHCGDAESKKKKKKVSHEIVTIDFSS